MAVLLPSLCVDQVTDITQDTLRALGVRALILDVDNTLSSHGSQEPFPRVRPQWKAEKERRPISFAAARTLFSFRSF